jgi:hypothetical protein
MGLRKCRTARSATLTRTAAKKNELCQTAAASVAVWFLFH